MSALDKVRAMARRLRGDDGFTLVETLFSLAITTAIIGGVGYLIFSFSTDTQRGSAQAVANQQMTTASALMSADVGRAQLLSAVPNGFDAAGSTPTGVWEDQWRVEGSDVVKYHWTGPAGSAWPGTSSVTTVGSRQVVSHGINGTQTSFSYYNSVGGQLNGNATAVAAGATFLPGATAAQKTSTSIARVTWNLAATPGKLVTLQHQIADVTMQGGNAKATPATAIPTTQLTCPSPIVSSSGGKATLRWLEAAGADSYAVLRDGTKQATIPAGSSDYSWTDSNSPTTTVAQYTVQMQVSSGRTVPTCNAVPYVPAPVISGTVDTTTSTFTVTWPPISGVTSYSCYSRPVDYTTGSPSGDWTLMSSGPAAKCTKVGQPGDEDQFKVTATETSNGVSTTSDDSNIITLLAGPGAPQMVSQNFTDATANTVANTDEFPMGSSASQTNQVHWYATAATAGYHVYASVDGAATKLVATVPQPSTIVAGKTLLTSPMFSNMALGSTTVYTVRAYNVDPTSGTQSESAPSNSKSVLQYPPVPAVAPVSVAATASHDILGYDLVQWSAAKSASGYHVESAPRGTSTVGTFTCLDTACTQNSGGLKALMLKQPAAPGTRTAFRVSAWNKTGLSPGYSSQVILTQSATSPKPATTDAPDLNSSAAAFTSAQTADAGNPAGYKFCAPGSMVCQYRLLKDGKTIDVAPQMSGSTTNWCYSPGKTCAYPNAWGDSFDYQVQVNNGALYNGGWSNVSPVDTINTYPAPFDINKISWNTAQTTTPVGQQYTYVAAGDSTLPTSGSATIDLSWGASTGVGLRYRYRVWRTGEANPWDSAFSTSRSYHNIPITDGNITYNVQVQVQSSNGLTRGGSDPTVTTDCAQSAPSTTDPACTAAFQSSPLMPQRLGEVQQYADGAGGNSYGHAYWAVKYYVAGTPIGSTSYANWDYSLGWKSYDRFGNLADSRAPAWHNSGAATTGLTSTLIKGNNGAAPGTSGYRSSEYVFTIQTRSTRTGVLNPITYSASWDMALSSGNPDVWENSPGGSTTQDAPYTPNNYPSTYGKGFIRYTTSDDPWAGGERMPGTSWTAW